MGVQSTRAKIINRRTYIRPANDEGTIFESDAAAVQRAVGHQEYLWVEAKKEKFAYLKQKAEHHQAIANESFDVSEADLNDSLATDFSFDFSEVVRLTPEETAELEALRELMATRMTSLSGRVKWMAGTEVIRERASAAFNCSFSNIKLPADVVDAFWLLLQGCGVGFRALPGMLSGFPRELKVEHIPSVRTARGGRENTISIIEDGVWTISFGDSAKGWAKGVGKLLSKKPAAVHTLRLDYSQLRPGGLRLRGYGWISSGWTPLRDGLQIIIDIMNRKAGKPLSTIDIGDMINALGTVLSSRRSAQIWLCDDDSPDLAEFITAKNNYFERGMPWRAQSNNSIAFKSKPTRDVLSVIFDSIINTGEPGLYNLEAAKKRAPWAEGTNPCAEIILPDKGFCVSGDTDLITATGLVKISEVEGAEIEIWNGDGFSKVTPFKTGDAATLFEVKLNDGSILRASANHRFQVFVKHKSAAWADSAERQVTTLELMELVSDESKAIRLPEFKIGVDYGSEHQFDAYTTGVYFGDGSQEDSKHASVDLYGSKVGLPVIGSRQGADRSTKNDILYQRVNMLHVAPTLRASIKTDISPVFSWTRAQRLQFLAGAFDADGSETDTGGLRLYVSGRRLGEQFQLLLRTVGIRASLNLMSSKGDITNFGPRSEDVWYVQVTDGRELPTHRLDSSNGHEPLQKGRFQLVKSVERLEGLHPTYCLTEPDRGMAVFGNMLTYQCNLVQIVFHRFNGNYDGLKKAVRLMARANYRQTLVSMRDGVLQIQWNDNNKLLRLCGVSPLGWVGWEYAEDAEKVQEIARIAIDAANEMADDLGEARPALVTQVQPGGTSSKVLGEDGDEVFEGVHIPLGRFIFNNVGFSQHDPIVEKCRAANYFIFENPYDSNSVLIRLPVEYPAGEHFTKFDRKIGEEKVYLGHGDYVTHDLLEQVEINVEGAIPQLNRYKFVMDNYVQHNCSVTISYDPSEKEAIVDWLLENWDSYIGVSFIRRNDPSKTAADLGHKYLPQEVVSEATFRAYTEGLLPISMEDDTSMDGVADQSCATGACPVR